MATWSEVHFSGCTHDLRLDAEFYHPKYLQQETRVTRTHHQRLIEIAHVSDGNHLAISEKFTDSGIRYLRGQDLTNFFISDSNPVFIPESEYRKLSRSQMVPGDILMGIIGTIGSIGLVTDRFGKLTGNCKLAIIRTIDIEPEYVAVYLSSKIGQDEIIRRTRGTVQMGLILPDIKDLPIPLLQSSKRQTIAELVKRSFSKRQESINCYKQAQMCFLQELGLEEIVLPEELYFERNLSDVKSNHRLDSEYFKPKFSFLLEKVQRTKPRQMLSFENILTSLTNGHTPANHDLSQGDVLFLTAENVSDFAIEYQTEKRILQQHHQGELARTALRTGDVLLTIKGKVGNAAFVKCPDEPVNINQDVALLRFETTLFPYYFISFLNSFIGKTFVEQLCTSQINPFLSLGNIRQIPVPIYENTLMKRIALKTEENVSKGRQTALESENLLNDARKIIECAILNCE